MASAQELERMVIRLLGDSENYSKMIDDAVRDTKRAAEEMNRATAQFRQQTKKNFDDAGNAVVRFQKHFKSMARDLTATGRMLTTRVTAPIVAFGALGVKAFSDFDNAMTESLSIMKGVTPELRAEMEGVAKQISGRSVTSARDLAKSYFFLASAGMNAQQSIKALPAVERFAVAGAFDMATATDLLTDAQTALGMSSKDPVKNLQNLIKLSDQLVGANQIANASVQQFSESLTADAAVASRQFGMSLETTLAVLGAYASQGKKGAEAGNLLGRSTRLLKKAFAENGKVFQKMGIKVVDEATGQYRDFVAIIRDMEVAFKDLTGPQRTVALEQLGFAALAQKSILPLIGLSDAMEDYRRSQKAAGDATNQVASTQLTAFAKQMKVTTNQIMLFASEVGKALVPVLTWLSDKIRDLIKWYQGLHETTKTVIAVVAVVAATIGPLLIALGLMANAIAVLGPALLSMTAAMMGLLNATVLLRVAMGGLILWVGFKLATAIYKSNAAIKEFNTQLERGRELSSELAKIHSKRRGNILKQAEGMTGSAKKTFLAEEIKRAKAEVHGYQGQLHRAAAEVKKQDTMWQNFIGAKALQLANEELKEKQQQLKGAKQHLDKLNAAMAKATAPVKKEAEGKGFSLAPDAKESQLDKNIKQVTENLKIQAETYGMTSREVDIYKLKLEGASMAQLQEAQSIINKLNWMDAEKQARQEHEKMLQRGKQIAKQYMTEEEKLAERRKELNHLFSMGAIDTETLTRALEDAEKQTKKDYTVNFGASGIQALQAGTAAASARLADFRSRQAKTPLNINAKTAVEKQSVEIDKKMLQTLEAIQENTGTDGLDNIVIGPADIA